MPPRRPTDDKEPLERLKDLIGFKWSWVITFLIGLYVPIFGIGYYFGGLSTRTEIGNTTGKTSNEEALSKVVVTYQQIITDNIQEKQHFKDSLSVLSKRVEAYYRIIKDQENGRKEKK